MFKMSFVLKKRKDGTISLVLPIWFRVLFLFIVVLLSAGVFVTGIGASGQWIPISIIIACIAGSLYEEKWVFDKPRNYIKYISGTKILYKKIIFKLEDIEIINITGEFHTEDEGRISRLRKKMVKLSLILKSGKVLDIEITTGKTESLKLQEKAHIIAKYCSKQLSVNSYQ